MLLIMAALVMGCGKKTGPTLHQVSGIVKLNGEPLDTGSISFIPTNGEGATAGGVIDEGKYSVKVPAGAKRVEIKAPKVVGQRKAYDTADSPMIDIVKERLPAKYHAASTLTITIKGNQKDADFDLNAT